MWLLYVPIKSKSISTRKVSEKHLCSYCDASILPGYLNYTCSYQPKTKNLKFFQLFQNSVYSAQLRKFHDIDNHGAFFDKWSKIFLCNLLKLPLLISLFLAQCLLYKIYHLLWVSILRLSAKRKHTKI